VSFPAIQQCDRVEYILAACEGKRVLHLGCADWPFTQEKFASGTLLHAKIAEVALHVAGSDLSHDGIAALRTLGFTDVFAHDATETLFQQFGTQFDVVVAGEVIEHVLNAGDLLQSIGTVLGRQSRLVLTTPNYCPIKRVGRLLYRREVVNPDHVCYYSRATLGKLLELTCYEVLEWKVHWWDVGTISKLSNKVLRRIPVLQYYADTLCLTARVKL